MHHDPKSEKFRRSARICRLAAVLSVTCLTQLTACTVYSAGSKKEAKAGAEISADNAAVASPGADTTVPGYAHAGRPDLSGVRAIGEAANESVAASADHIQATLLYPELADAQVIPDDDDRVTFAFAGDILLDEGYAAGAAIRERGITNCFDAEAMDVMTGADIFLINNEFTYTNSTAPYPDKKYTFHANPSAAADLKEIGVDIVTLANNHTFDYQEVGLLDTLDALDAIGMPHIGAGHNLDEAKKPYYYNADGMTIAVISATQIERYPNSETRGATDTLPGVFRSYDPALLYQVVAETKQKADFVIVCMHWGTEKMKTTDAGQVTQAQGLVDAGADLIIGDHPHILQEIGYIGDVPIIYSLGNYLFTSYTTDTGVLQVTLQPSTRSVAQVRFVPMQQVGTAVKTLSGSEKTRVLSELREVSGTVNIDDDGIVTKK